VILAAVKKIANALTSLHCE